MPETSEIVWSGEEDLRPLLVPIDELREDPRNVRSHADRGTAEVRRSLSTYGQQKPIVVDESGETIAGAGTLRAAKEEGWTHLAAVRSKLDGAERRGYAIADNRTGELSTWDLEALATELRDLGDSAPLGFDADEIAALLGTGSGGGSGGGAGKGGGEGGAGSLARRFVVPPMSVLDSRQGYWQDRKRAWMDFGIRSHEGREENKLGYSTHLRDAQYYRKLREAVPKEQIRGAIALQGTSIFDPVLCELLLRWFAPTGGKILDPFAGGSVRGLVSSVLGYDYLGFDLSKDQVEANRKQAKELAEKLKIRPKWREADSMSALADYDGAEFDLVLSCPPYYDLETYSDDDRDLSNLATYEGFLNSYETVIRAAVEKLRDHRFVAWVVSEIRDPKLGSCRGFVPDTVEIFERAGLALFNEMTLVQPVCTGTLKVSRTFAKGRKVCRVHQNVLVFVKGNAEKALEELGPIEEGSLPLDEESAEDPTGAEAEPIGGEI